MHNDNYSYILLQNTSFRIFQTVFYWQFISNKVFFILNTDGHFSIFEKRIQDAFIDKVRNQIL